MSEGLEVVRRFLIAVAVSSSAYATAYYVRGFHLSFETAFLLRVFVGPGYASLQGAAQPFIRLWRCIAASKELRAHFRAHNENCAIQKRILSTATRRIAPMRSHEAISQNVIELTRS